MSTGRVLLVVDLEGVVGVDSVSALVAGTPQYAQSRAALTREINATVEGLLGAGFSHVRVSDSHMSGSEATNVLAESLHPAAELRFEEDWYSAALFEGVQAVACLGMHAPGGLNGFAAHTVDPLGSWLCAGRLLSESDIVLALAAEAGVPALFISGDDTLQAHLGDRVPFVRTKVSLSPTHAASRPSEDVLADLVRAASLAPTPLRPLPEAPLRLVFKSARRAALAAETGARRVERHQVEVAGASFRERYQQALRAASAASSVLESSLRGPVGSPEFVEDVSALLSLSGPHAASPPSRAEPAERALRAFLRLSEGSDDESRALRALILHMLEGHAPRAFTRWGLGPILEQAVEALAAVPRDLGPQVAPGLGMARVDAWYVRHVRGLESSAPPAGELRRYLELLEAEGYSIYAWLLGELALACGVDVRLPFFERPRRGDAYPADLYWLTHLFLVDTHYLHRPLRDARAHEWLEELLLAAPRLIAEGQADLAAEVALCLQCAGEAGGGVHEALLELIVQRQQPGGEVKDVVPEEEGAWEVAHTTAAAMLALAGAEWTAIDNGETTPPYSPAAPLPQRSE
ncbi:M55 family metallopeptidase [Pyxidicoccus xibeiensis]|uniref:M55 family metallopeptidase n=1 Tax=Pyxidicoccus xibeiensis TaxID=2906759 RepID=UPI0020A6F148|nr:M55 family metallopeptidase [Pyxidicoccus xibeiensis]MCP3138175.1 M55 family metallopeptidase [Pyxidicoccus xibeiensis]